MKNKNNYAPPLQDVFVIMNDLMTPQINQQSKDVAMYNNPCHRTEQERARDYLEIRAADVRSAHKSTLARHFGIEDDAPPKTIKELKERLAEGKFRTHENYKDDTNIRYESLDHLIRWRTRDADKDGFRTAKESLAKTYTELQDIIVVKTPDEGLKALQEFEKKTFH